MTSASGTTDRYFQTFGVSLDNYELPTHFTMLTDNDPHPLCVLAAQQLQHHLDHEAEWNHNFGLSEEQQGSIIGKMFGVLVVKNRNGDIGYLTAFSGKLGGGNHHAAFVPPVFDSLTDNSFVNMGMTELTRIIQHIIPLPNLK